MCAIRLPCPGGPRLLLASQWGLASFRDGAVSCRCRSAALGCHALARPPVDCRACLPTKQPLDQTRLKDTTHARTACGYAQLAGRAGGYAFAAHQAAVLHGHVNQLNSSAQVGRCCRCWARLLAGSPAPLYTAPTCTFTMHGLAIRHCVHTRAHLSIAGPQEAGLIALARVLAHRVNNPWLDSGRQRTHTCEHIQCGHPTLSTHAMDYIYLRTQ